MNPVGAISVDFFQLLSLPPPSIDALGRPVWPFTDKDVKKAFHKAALRYHPDKCDEQMQGVFNDLKDGMETLMNPSKRQKYLLAYVEPLKKAASLEGRLGKDLLADKEMLKVATARRKAAASLLSQDSVDFSSQVRQEMQQRRQTSDLFNLRAKINKMKRKRVHDDRSSESDSSDASDLSPTGQEPSAQNDVKRSSSPELFVAKKRGMRLQRRFKG